MQVETNPLRAFSLSAAATLRNNAQAVVQAAKNFDTTVHDTIVGTMPSLPIARQNNFPPLEPPSSGGVSLRPNRPPNQIERTMRDRPDCFARVPGSSEPQVPRSISESNAAMRCADGPVVENLLIVATQAAGALEGVAGLPSRPMPGYEREYYTARKAAAIETLIVGVVSGVGAARAAADGVSIAVGSGGAASVTSVASASSAAAAAATSAVIAEHAVAEALTNDPIRAEGVGDKRPGRAHEPQQPPRTLKAFPNAKLVRGKTRVQGGGSLRDRWLDDKGHIFEWDSRHGTVEMYDRRGRHLGEFNPTTGKQTGHALPNRRVTP